VELMRPIKIVIVDRNVIARIGLKALLSEANEPYEVLAVFATLLEAEAIFPHRSVDILIVDDMVAPPTEIMTFIKQCHECQPGLSIIILSERRDRDYIQSVTRYGTSSYILKSPDLHNQLLIAIKMMSAKYLFISPKAVEIIGRDSVKTLELRDKEVLCLLAQERTIKEISMELEITSKTVYRIRSRLKRILGVRNNEMIIDAARKKELLSNLD
jgi:two-component system invasion response regulator UvrY